MASALPRKLHRNPADPIDPESERQHDPAISAGAIADPPPIGVPQARLIEISSPLCARSRAVIARLRPDITELGQFAASRVATAELSAGFAHIDGDAIAASVDRPGRVVEFSLFDLYNPASKG